MVSNLIRNSLLLAALAVPVVVSAADDVPLTLTRSVQLAVSQSRLVEAQRQQGVAAREMAVSAGQLPDPVLKLGINNLPINGEDRFSLTQDFMTMRSIGVMQELTRDAKRQARSARFQREAETAEAAGELTSAKVQSGTAMAWLDRYYQERALDLLLRQKTETLLQVDAADAGYRGGRGSQSDVFAARTAVAQVEDRIAQARRQVVTAKSQLARWVGAVAEQRQSDLPAMDVLRWHEADLDTQLQHHPQITVMEKQEAVAQADADLARANKKSDWSLEVMASQRGSAYSDMVSVNFSLPLQWDAKNRQDRELAAKLAVVDQLRAEREDAVRAHVFEVRAMLQEWQSNRDRLKRYDASILPLATERTQAALAAYRGGVSGGGTLSAVLEARRAEIDSRMEYLRLEMETARLWAQLNYLTPMANNTAASNP